MADDRRLAKINTRVQRVFGAILHKEADLPADTLVTITKVETVANLRSTKVWLSVYPETAREETLARLTAQLYDLQGALNRALDVQPVPRLLLRIDYGASHAEHIQRTLAQLADEDGKPAAEESPGNG